MIYALITSAFKGWANKSSLCKNNFCGRCGETHPSSHSAGKAPSQQRCRGRLSHHPHLASKGMWCWEDGWEESLAWRVPAGEGAQGVHHPFPLSLCPDMPCSVSCRAGTWCAPQQQVQGLGLGVWDLGGKVCALLTEENTSYLWYCFQYCIYKLPQCWGSKEGRDEAGSWTCDPTALTTALGMPELQTHMACPSLTSGLEVYPKAPRGTAAAPGRQAATCPCAAGPAVQRGCTWGRLCWPYWPAQLNAAGTSTCWQSTLEVQMWAQTVVLCFKHHGVKPLNQLLLQSIPTVTIRPEGWGGHWQT